MKEAISVVWLKRDLRLDDNEAIQNALNSDRRVLLLYVFENVLLSDEHYSERHFNFIKESLRDLNSYLRDYNTQILTVVSDLSNTFNQIQSLYRVVSVYSHVETGLLVTYNRDKEFKRYCRNNFINWVESKNNAVERGLLNRDNWFDNWETYMLQPLIEFKANTEQFLNHTEIDQLLDFMQPAELQTPESSPFQKGGSTIAWKYAESFFDSRHKTYMYDISKPENSRTSCSRLSP